MRARNLLLVLATLALLAGCGQKPQVHADAGSSVLPLECEGDALHCDVLTSFRGINVYRNIGATGFCTDDQCHHPQNRYGTRWQCVELFNRFFVRQFGTEPVPGDAKELFANAAQVAGLEPRRNGGIHPPVPGDALVLAGSATGHVAIIVKVTRSHVHVVEQNVPGDGTGSYRYDPETRTVTAAQPATVLGWIHATANLASPRVTSAA